RDIEREERRAPQLVPAVDPEQCEDAEEIPDELVEESRGGLVECALAVDLERPRQRRVLSVELLVPVVAPAAGPLRKQEAGRDRVHHQPHAVPRAPDDPRTDGDAERDRAPDPEAARPDGERPVPVRVDRRVLVPARDVVVEARADDAGDYAPDRDAE